MAAPVMPSPGLRKPVLHWLLLGDVGHISALSSPSCSLSLLTRLHTPFPQICALLGRLLFPVGWRLVWRAGSCSSNRSMGNYASCHYFMKNFVSNLACTSYVLIGLDHLGTPSHILHQLNWAWRDKVSSDKSCLFHGNMIICPNQPWLSTLLFVKTFWRMLGLCFWHVMLVV